MSLSSKITQISVYFYFFCSPYYVAFPYVLEHHFGCFHLLIISLSSSLVTVCYIKNFIVSLNVVVEHLTFSPHVPSAFPSVHICTVCTVYIYFNVREGKKGREIYIIGRRVCPGLKECVWKLTVFP